MKRVFLGVSKRILTSAVILFTVACAAYSAADPVIVEFHYQNGIKFYKRGMYERARQEFKKTLTLDEGHKEAKEYFLKLEKMRLTREDGSYVEDGTSDAGFRSRLEEGKRLYRSGDYEEAIRVFDKVLEDKHIDSAASFYRERCETLLARRLKKEAKAGEKKKLGVQAALKKEAGRSSREERRQVLEKRKEIKKERRAAFEEKAAEGASLERELAPRKPHAPAASGQKQKKKGRGKPRNPLEEFKDTKESFLKGVEHYGRREYKEALVSFKEVIEQEKREKRFRYSDASRRFMEKAKKKMVARPEGGGLASK